HAHTLQSPGSRTTPVFAAPRPPPHLYTLSLHLALPIPSDLHFDMACPADQPLGVQRIHAKRGTGLGPAARIGLRQILASAHHAQDRKSTRLNSSHVEISYAVFCLKKKKELVMVGDVRCT